MLEMKSFENRIKQIELELGEREKLTPQVKSLILNMRTNIALLKGQFNLLMEKHQEER